MKRSHKKNELEVNIATLKAKLSYYLGRVKKGHMCTITDHRLPIARIFPFKNDAYPLNSIPPKKSFLNVVKRFVPVKIDFNVKIDSTSLLLEDRGKR